MSDPKRNKPKDRKREETKPDRPLDPLPSITAPRFQPSGQVAAAPSSEVSITSPHAAPGGEERTNTETLLDPAAYAPTPDKNPHELSSDFQPISGKQLDAGGRLVAQAAPVSRRTPAVAEEEAATDAAVPQYRPAPTPSPPPRRSSPRVVDSSEPMAPPPASQAPIPKVDAQRREPGRWVINREAPAVAEPPEPPSEPSGEGALDPTVRRAAPSRTGGRRRLIVIGAVVVGLALSAGVTVWLTQSSQPSGATGTGVEPQRPTTPTPTPAPEPARIRITSKPAGATVHINGLSIGLTPVDRESPFAPEAELEVEVLLKGYRPWTRRFHAGQDVEAHANLRPTR